MDGGVDVSSADYLNFSNVHRYFKRVKGVFAINPKYVGPMLGFLMIRDLPKLYETELDDKNNQPVKAIKIINEHLKGDRDVLACQEELIIAGLKEFAKL